MKTKSLLVAGTSSNVGKTTVTIGLISAFISLGKVVQGFKCGPDYIDPSFQTQLTGRPAHNLDSWMCQEKDVDDIFKSASQGADVSIIEGVMGLFDGKSPLEDKGSSVEIARLTQTPILLVLDCSGLARSAAAIVKGYQAMAEEAEIIGVVANFVGSEGHFKLIEAAIEQECDIPVIGYLTKDNHLKIPERQQGLAPVDFEQIAQFGGIFIKQFDLTLLESRMRTFQTIENKTEIPKAAVRLGVLKDECFPFYYEANLTLLKSLGAEIVEFSLLEDNGLPSNLDGIILGGGYPELYAEEFINRPIFKLLREKIEAGLPVYAEGAGLILLMEKLILKNGETYPMLGLVEGETVMQNRLAGFGYRQVSGAESNKLLKQGEIAKGHVYHYGQMLPTEVQAAYESDRPIVSLVQDNIYASNVHFHFYSAPQIAERIVEMCRKHIKD